MQKTIIYEPTEAGEELLNKIGKVLSVDNYRLIIDRALKSFQAQVDLLGEGEDQVDIMNLAGDKKIRVRIR
jgi:hypothetical protein